MGLSFLSNPFCAIVGLKNEFPIFWCVLLYCKTKWKSSQVLSFPIGFEKPCGKGIREMALVAKAFSNIQPYFFLKLPFFFSFLACSFFISRSIVLATTAIPTHVLLYYPRDRFPKCIFYYALLSYAYSLFWQFTRIKPFLLVAKEINKVLMLLINPSTFFCTTAKPTVTTKLRQKQGKAPLRHFAELQLQPSSS